MTDLDPAIEQRVTDLLARMTLTEKLGQLSQFFGLEEAHKDLIRQGLVGSVLNVVTPAAVNALQRLAIEESRLGIPLLFGRDVIHGFRTVFPIPLGQAATWDPETVQAAARVAAVEATADGVSWTFAPMVDIARDPRWGRIAEGLGEDPLLGATLAGAMVRGFQGERPEDLARPDCLAACAKHFVGYGAAEGGRDYNTAEISERTLREVYLPPFRGAVDAGCATLMSAFCEISGVPASANRFTLTQVLREEWGFQGFVVSDWTSVTEMIAHGYAADEREAGRRALTAGVDMEMVSRSFINHGEALIQAGQVPAAVVDEAVRRVLRIKFRLGLFERPYADPQRPAAVIGCAAHRDLARQVARESLVLLRNEGNLLPLNRERHRLAVIGPLADAPAELLGCWAMDGRAEDVVAPLRALREAVGSGSLLYSAGLPDCRSTDSSGIAHAVHLAREADVVILFVGEPAILSGEAHCRAFLDLPGAQPQLVDAILATGKPVVVVLLAGRPLALPSLFARATAVLMAWHPGVMGGPAIADVLLGVANPGGHLPVSWPRAVGQIPLYYNHKNTGRPPLPETAGVPLGTPLDPVGYCSTYLDAPPTSQFPFGFGLSYTRFEYSDLAISPPTSDGRAAMTVAATVRNAGERAGDEVVQLYVRDLAGNVTRPVRELKGFRRLRLAPGESQRVSFTLTPRMLAFYDEQMRLIVEPGEFVAWVGPDSASGLEGSFAITGSAPLVLPPGA